MLEPLQLATNVVQRRSILPVLSNLLVAVEDNLLRLTGTDQEVELGAQINSLQCDESGEITVPARKFLEICRSLPEGARMECQLQESRLTIESGRFISHLATLPAVDFPNVEMASNGIAFTLTAKTLHRLLKNTSFAMAQQDVRYFFNGVLVEMEANLLRFVATNGQRLASSFVEDIETGTGTQQFIVPRKGVHELARIVPDDANVNVELKFSSNHMQVCCGQATLTTKLIDATYPDSTRDMTEGEYKILEVRRGEIRRTLRATATV